MMHMVWYGMICTTLPDLLVHILCFHSPSPPSPYQANETSYTGFSKGVRRQGRGHPGGTAVTGGMQILPKV